MKEQESTIICGKQVKKEEKKKKSLTKVGKWVTVGGSAAVLLGSAVLLSSFSSEDTDEVQDDKDLDGNGENEHEEGGGYVEGNEGNGNPEDASDGVDVDNEPSFDESFADAREALGPGGVFTYQGNLYSTYLKEEWDSMTSEQQSEYTDQAVDRVEEETADTGQTEPDVEIPSNEEVPVDDSEDADAATEDGDIVEAEEIGEPDVDVDADVYVAEEDNSIVEPVDADPAVSVEDDKSLIEEVVDFIQDVINPNEPEDIVEPDVIDDLSYTEPTDDDLVDGVLSDESAEPLMEKSEDISTLGDEMGTTDNLDSDLPDYMSDAAI